MGGGREREREREREGGRGEGKVKRGRRGDGIFFWAVTGTFIISTRGIFRVDITRESRLGVFLIMQQERRD
jgi:hypothetical protein